MVEAGNLFAHLPAVVESEQFLDLYFAPGVKIERIVSTGQTTPGSEWLEQNEAEWVALLAGAAVLRFENESSPRTLGVGDWLLIPARARHRVEWTDPKCATIWLAVHIAVG